MDSGDEVSMPRCPQLTRSNYTRWAVQMKAILQAHDVWGAVDPGGVVFQQGGTSYRKDRQALMIIYHMVPEEYLLKLIDKDGAKVAWDAIKAEYVGHDHVGESKPITQTTETVETSDRGVASREATSLGADSGAREDSAAGMESSGAGECSSGASSDDVAVVVGDAERDSVANTSMEAEMRIDPQESWHEASRRMRARSEHQMRIFHSWEEESAPVHEVKTSHLRESESESSTPVNEAETDPLDINPEAEELLIGFVYLVVAYLFWSSDEWGGVSRNAGESSFFGSGAFNFTRFGVVHTVGSIAGLWGELIEGLRITCSNHAGGPVILSRHSAILVLLETFIWFEWYGYNPGFQIACFSIHLVRYLGTRAMRRMIHRREVDGKNKPVNNSRYYATCARGQGDVRAEYVRDEENRESIHWIFLFSNVIAQWAQCSVQEESLQTLNEILGIPFDGSYFAQSVDSSTKFRGGSLLGVHLVQIVDDMQKKLDTQIVLPGDINMKTDPLLEDLVADRVDLAARRMKAERADVARRIARDPDQFQRREYGLFDAEESNPWTILSRRIADAKHAPTRCGFESAGRDAEHVGTCRMGGCTDATRDPKDRIRLGSEDAKNRIRLGFVEVKTVTRSGG